jgi:hypothetical protein
VTALAPLSISIAFTDSLLFPTGLDLVLIQQVTRADGTTTLITVPGVGDNGMVRRPINIGNVKKLNVYFTGSGTITYMKHRICLPAGGSFPPPPAPTCNSTYYQKECTTDAHCGMNYGCGTCTSNVCMCSGQACGCNQGSFNAFTAFPTAPACSVYSGTGNENLCTGAGCKWTSGPNTCSNF